jgi:p-hydroxybenzoate 3-monooxygenase
MMYGQREIVRDMVAGLLAVDGKILFEVTDVELHGIDGRTPSITFHSAGQDMALECEFIVGCDGYHGICRPAIAPALSTFDVAHGFSWVAVLAQTKPVAEEVVYACHDRGLALFSLRSRAVARFYLQCPQEEQLDAWPVDRIWDEARLRLEGGAFVLEPGPILESSMVRMRSFVAEPMQHGRLFLAGDAAHIVPPSAAKGLNLAVADVYQLAQALQERYRSGDASLLRDYSRIALERVWEGQRFSDWMTRLLHTNINGSAMDRRIQLAELDHLMATQAALGNFVESYVGPKMSC